MIISILRFYLASCFVALLLWYNSIAWSLLLDVETTPNNELVIMAVCFVLTWGMIYALPILVWMQVFFVEWLRRLES